MSGNRETEESMDLNQMIAEAMHARAARQAAQERAREEQRQREAEQLIAGLRADLHDTFSRTLLDALALSYAVVGNEDEQAAVAMWTVDGVPFEIEREWSSPGFYWHVSWPQHPDRPQQRRQSARVYRDDAHADETLLCILGDRRVQADDDAIPF
jgi:hypothetical protein